jgi:hypothetical protein
MKALKNAKEELVDVEEEIGELEDIDENSRDNE